MEKSDQNQEKFYLFCLSQIKGLGNNIIWRLLKKYQRPSIIFEQSVDLGDNINKLITQAKNDYTWRKKTKTEFAKYKNYLTILEPDYPLLLQNIYDPPLFLFYRGNIKLLQSNFLLTIVGSRQTTNYHQAVLKKITNSLRNTPLILVSGLALGIDALVHQQALANNLNTMAVLGGGVNDEVLYPATNKKLANEVLANNNLIISEYPDNTKPDIYTFPKRNRILAGLSKMTIVISGAQKSGTLITAQVALDEGREVYALPGNINLKLSQGPNQLINQGASLLNSSQDILKVYNLDNKTKNQIPEFDNSLQRTIYSLVQLQPLSVNQLAEKLKLDLIKINQTVSELELKSLVNINQANQVEVI